MPNNDLTKSIQLTPTPGTKMVVVGGCGGMGRVLVQAAIEMELAVIVVDLPQSIEQFPVPEGVTAVACNAMDAAEVASAFQKIDEQWGVIDHLVNLVGFTKEQVNIEDMSEAEWDEILDGSLKSAFLIARHGIPLLRKSRSGLLLNTSSTFGVQVPFAGYGPYSAAKAGIINLTRALAVECGPDIRVNAIAPGLVDTQFLKGGTGRTEKTSRVSTNAMEQIPLKRIGDPRDIAGTALFLASPAASYITSQTIHVNGGLWS